MQLTYQVSRKTLLQGSRLQTDFIGIGLAFGEAMIAVPFVTSISDRSLMDTLIGWNRLLLLSVGLGLASGALFALGYWAILLPLKVRRMHQQNPLLYGETRLVADERGVELIGPRGTSKFAWQELRGFKENADVFVICLSRSVGYAIPKREHVDGDVSRFADLLRWRLKRL